TARWRSNNKKGAARAPFPSTTVDKSGGDDLFAGRIAQHIAAAPDRLDIVVAIGCRRELLAALADEDVDVFDFRLVHPAIKVVQEHFLGQRGALAQREQ